MLTTMIGNKGMDVYLGKGNLPSSFEINSSFCLQMKIIKFVKICDEMEYVNLAMEEHSAVAVALRGARQVG